MTRWQLSESSFNTPATTTVAGTQWSFQSSRLAKINGLVWRAFSRGAAEGGSPENFGPMSRFALEALDAKAIVPEGGTQSEAVFFG